MAGGEGETKGGKRRCKMIGSKRWEGKELRKADGESANNAFMGSHKQNDCNIMNNILENKFH